MINNPIDVETVGEIDIDSAIELLLPLLTPILIEQRRQYYEQTSRNLSQVE